MPSQTRKGDLTPVTDVAAYLLMWLLILGGRPMLNKKRRRAHCGLFLVAPLRCKDFFKRTYLFMQWYFDISRKTRKQSTWDISKSGPWRGEESETILIKEIDCCRNIGLECPRSRVRRCHWTFIHVTRWPCIKRIIIHDVVSALLFKTLSAYCVLPGILIPLLKTTSRGKRHFRFCVWKKIWALCIYICVFWKEAKDAWSCSSEASRYCNACRAGTDKSLCVCACLCGCVCMCVCVVKTKLPHIFL